MELAQMHSWKETLPVFSSVHVIASVQRIQLEGSTQHTVQYCDKLTVLVTLLHVHKLVLRCIAASACIRRFLLDTAARMANLLLPGVCLPGDSTHKVFSPVPFRQAVHAHVLSQRRGCKALGHTALRSTKVQAHATEAPAKSKARPGEKKGAAHTLFVTLSTQPAKPGAKDTLLV